MRASHAVLSRLVVRMQHDPGLVARVFADPEAVLGPLGLGARERAMLLATDRRAFLHDPFRIRRLLRTLMEDFKASSAIALEETRRLAFLDGFFASAEFHEAVQADGSLGVAFAGFLVAASLQAPVLGPVVRLELALFRARQELAAAGGADWRAPAVPAAGLRRVARAPGVAAVRVLPDALAAVQAVEQYLFEVGLVPAIALADDAPRLVLPAPTGAPPTPMGIVPTASGVHLVELEPALFDAIDALMEGPRDVDAIGRPLAEALVEDEVLVVA